MRWAARFFRQAVRKDRPLARREPARLRLEALEGREVPTVTGTAYIDLNLNGSQDPEDTAVAGVIVTATDSTGATETATTGADGSYTLQTSADKLRIVFSNLPEGTLPGRVTTTSGPLVRFLDANSDRTSVDLALASPQLVTSQFFYDDALNGANSTEAAVASVPYGADSSVSPNTLATVADVGSVWGLAYQPASNSIYASAFLKTHAGFGPAADGTSTTTGGIYHIDPTGTNSPTLLVDLNKAGAGLGTGADPHPTQTDADGGDWFHDSATVPLVGKRGLGGLAMSADGRTLYTVNLATRELVEVPLNADGTRDTSRTIRHTPIPLGNFTGSGIGSFNASDLRPFAVAVRNGAVFVGVTYTAETSGLAADLRAFVDAFDPNQGAFRSYNLADGKFSNFGATPVLSVNLTYPRGLADDPTPDNLHSGDEVSANWRAWTNTFDTSTGQDGFPVHPQPWLTDIAFDGSNMILGIRDRFGDQGGFQTGNTKAGDTNEFSAIAVGDILRAGPPLTANGASGWQLESNGSSGGVTTAGAGNGQGPGGGEFYYQDNASDPVPQEVTSGALVQVPGFHTVAATGEDVQTAFTGGIYTFFNSNTAKGSDASTAGTVHTKTELYQSSDLNTFGSANGLGGLAALPGDGTVQVGDRVFVDTNGNGIQDAGEPGLAGVVLTLFQGGTQVDSVTSGAGGDYLFNALKPNTAYQIRIDTTQAALAGRTLASANQGTDSQLNSKATLSGTTAMMSFTTGDAGTSDHSLDAGFSGSGTAPPSLTLGNLVFRDANNNGTFDAGETGIAGVSVQLLDSTGTTVQSTTTTDGSGQYSFDGLAAGTYRVRLAASNFNAGGPLAGFTPSTTASTNPDDNVNNDSNGSASGTLGSGGFVVSGPIALAVGTGPIVDGNTDPNANLTLDFGMVPPAAVAPTLTLGDTVFRDANNNGTQDAQEPGIAGVNVELLNSTGMTAQSTTTTDASGHYKFTGLAAGTYRVRLATSNFSAGGHGPLAGFNPSTTVSTNPNDNINNDNNGSASGTLSNGGFVVSGPIALAAGTGPIGDGNTDPNANLTLDFGMVPPAAPSTLTLGDTVFRDANNNGTLDSGEAGIAGVSVQLLDSTGTTVLNTTTTDASGKSSFGGLAAGNYILRLPASDFTGTGPVAGYVGSTTSSNSPSGSINNGITTGALGAAGYIQSAPITLTAGTDQSLGFGLVQQTAATKASLSGRTFLDFNNNGALNGPDTGISGVTISLSGGGLAAPMTAQTDSAGNFAFNNLAAGTYTLTETQPTTPANQNGKITAGSAGGSLSGVNIVSGIKLTAGQSATGYLFAEVPLVGTGGAVYQDLNGNGKKDSGEPGISGVTITLTGTSVVSGVISPKTATTDSSGNYSFTGLTPGTYAIAETQPAGFTDGKEENGTPAATTVTNDKFAGIDLTSTAATSGGFNFGEVAGTGTGNTASVSGTVFDDVNNDGVKAATGEAGIAGVKVRLLGTNDRGSVVDMTTTTAADGSYLFRALRPGTYRLVETQPAGYSDGKDTAGSAGGSTTTNDQITGIHLTAETNAAGYLFGEHATADLSLTQSPGSATINPGGTVTITYTLKNKGTATATAAAVAMNFGGLTFVSASTPAAFDSTTKKWTVGDLAAGATQTIRITYRATVAGTFAPSAHATTTATELLTTNNTSSSVISVGIVPPPITTPTETHGFLGRLWFLSSSTNARRIVK